MKRYVWLTALLMIASCTASYQAEDFRCPNVKIPGGEAYLTQIVNYRDNFRVELTGYEGYCYVVEGTSRRYAVITPQFRLTRLQDSADTAVDFSFYTNIEQGPPEFVGKRSYFARGKLDVDDKETTFSGRPVKVKIPVDQDDIEILLGLDVSAEEAKYNQRTFDTRSRERGRRKDGIVETPCGFIEVEEADFSEGPTTQIQTPTPAPKTSECGSCSVRR